MCRTLVLGSDQFSILMCVDQNRAAIPNPKQMKLKSATLAMFIIFDLFIFLAGCLLDGVAPSAPPDVPPRNPTMSRMNGRVTGNPSELGVDFEPSCLVRTPSGNVYIPSGNISK